jgi:hypothetical protein
MVLSIPDQIERILSYASEPGWDGEDAVIIKHRTLEKAAGYIESIKAMMLKERQVVFELPYINPCPDGSIDIHWNEKEYEFLANIPLEGENASFYGDFRGYQDKKPLEGIMKADGSYVFTKG